MVTLDGSPDASTLSENGTASAASGCASASDDVNASASADCSSTAARGGARLRCVCSPSMSASAPFCLQRPHLPGLTAVWMNDRSDLSMVMDCESCAHHSGGMESVNHAQECGLPARSSVGIVVLLINSKMRTVCPAQTLGFHIALDSTSTLKPVATRDLRVKRASAFAVCKGSARCVHTHEALPVFTWEQQQRSESRPQELPGTPLAPDDRGKARQESRGWRSGEGRAT